MKKGLILLILFCGFIVYIYGQENHATISFKLSPNIVELIGLYEEYETQCFNDSTKQCFNYYEVLHVFYDSTTLEIEQYKTPCTKWDMDLGIDSNYTGTREEWIHVEPTLIGFMQYLKEKR